MSIHVNDGPQPHNNTSFKPIPLMSFYVPPIRQPLTTQSISQSHTTQQKRQPHIIQPKRLSTTSNRPRLYSDVCRQPPTSISSINPINSHHRPNQHQPQTNQQRTNPPTPQAATPSSPTTDPITSDLTLDFNTELIELS